jgi:uncharacterized C2H2 Zn-finger protein
MNFRYKLAQLLRGRYLSYGVDLYSKILAIICIILSVINLFLGSIIIYLVQTTLFIWLAYRLFSRNISARQKENQKILNFLTLKKRIHNDRNTHIYKKCPHCGVTLRLPRRPGEHNVNCPRCKNDFKVKVR